ncbi:hypothetical protein FB451DRAFT_1403221 [Mycena latifolia]|nr:hypothetical protein FB451DRAFT_1403221 [Mycena latifolia]
MAQNLPQELVDLVLGAVSESHTIAQCGLVCRNWLPSSRYRYFAEIDLNDRTIKLFISVVEASPFPLPSFIRSLRLSSRREDGSLEEDLRKLGPLPQLRALSITMDHAIFPRNYRFLAKSFANISSLTLRNCHFPLSSLLEALPHFPTLKSFALLWVGFDREPLDVLPAAAYQFPSGCHSLSLTTLEWGPVDVFFKAILSFKTMPVFSLLSVRGMEPTEGSLGEYLRRVGDGIHHLRVESDFAFSGSSPTNLQFCTGLRRLELAFHYSLNIPATLLRILPHLRSSHLATVHVTDAFGNTDAPYLWREVDDALSDERFANLRAFTFHWQAPRGRHKYWDLTGLMPSSQARGILREVAEP